MRLANLIQHDNAAGDLAREGGVKKGGEIIADGVTVYKNGKWLM
ncbi:MAG: hypothetical protein Q7J68_01985 [Thermoplasmata archaeon]|nr:hypothetical protein [Thermoplasmata archaeon]